MFPLLRAGLLRWNEFKFVPRLKDELTSRGTNNLKFCNDGRQTNIVN